MPSEPTLTAYPTLGYLTRRQPPGTGILPGPDGLELEEGAVAG